MLKSLILSLVSHRTAAVLRWDLHFLVNVIDYTVTRRLNLRA